jgi:hypothetical protein
MGGESANSDMLRGKGYIVRGAGHGLTQVIIDG